MFYCPSNPCCDKILVVLCSSPPICTPWTTKRALVHAVLQNLTFQDRCLGLGKEAKEASKFLPRACAACNKWLHTAEFRDLCTPGQTRALQDVTALICACPEPTRDKRQCQERWNERGRQTQQCCYQLGEAEQIPGAEQATYQEPDLKGCIPHIHGIACGPPSVPFAN